MINENTTINQANIIAQIKRIANEILDILEKSYSEDPTSIQKLEFFNNTRYHFMRNFLQISNMILKIIPIEQNLNQNPRLSEKINGELTEQEKEILREYYKNNIKEKKL